MTGRSLRREATKTFAESVRHRLEGIETLLWQLSLAQWQMVQEIPRIVHEPVEHNVEQEVSQIVHEPAEHIIEQVSTIPKRQQELSHHVPPSCPNPHPPAATDNNNNSFMRNPL